MKIYDYLDIYEEKEIIHREHSDTAFATGRTECERSTAESAGNRALAKYHVIGKECHFTWRPNCHCMIIR